jgi:hypothetical protein
MNTMALHPLRGCHRDQLRGTILGDAPDHLSAQCDGRTRFTSRTCRTVRPDNPREIAVAAPRIVSRDAGGRHAS